MDSNTQTFLLIVQKRQMIVGASADAVDCMLSLDFGNRDTCSCSGKENYIKIVESGKFE